MEERFPAYLYNKNRVTDVENKHGYQGIRDRRINWEIEIDIYILLYIEWASLVAQTVNNMSAMPETQVHKAGN